VKHGHIATSPLPYSIGNIARKQARKPESQHSGFQLFITIREALVLVTSLGRTPRGLPQELTGFQDSD
jgi:hypothetical protein